MPEDIEFKGEQFSFCNGNYTYCDENNCDRWLFDDLYSTLDILNYDVDPLEDEIDIDNIEKLLKIEEYEVDKTDVVLNRNKINELVKAVKQLDRKIREER